MAVARLGDIIDDFCPRCRMLTNHSVAALVGEDVKKVFCRTCQHSHDYKHGQGTEKKKKTSKQSAYEQVLASVLAGKNLEDAAKPEPVSRPKRSLAATRPRTAPLSHHRPSRPR